MATLSRSPRQPSAAKYLGDEIIKDIARRMLFEVAGERPGADLMEAPRTVPLPLALAGITVAALAEAMQVRSANEPPDHLEDVIAPLTGHSIRSGRPAHQKTPPSRRLPRCARGHRQSLSHMRTWM